MGRCIVVGDDHGSSVVGALLAADTLFRMRAKSSGATLAVELLAPMLTKGSGPWQPPSCQCCSDCIKQGMTAVSVSTSLLSTISGRLVFRSANSAATCWFSDFFLSFFVALSSTP